MNNLYEVLEICLQDIERGESIETVLFRYPEFADELRPILEGSISARSMAITAPSAEVVRRNRAKVLQHAAQMREREARAKSSARRSWFASLRRVAVTLTVVAMLFVSGTGLVRAASTTLPGDNLYPVKRTWEDVLVLLTFNLQQRDALEIEHENKRLQELREVFAEGRATEVEFSGVATSQTGNEWLIAGIRVVISDQTEVRDGPLAIGSAVRVKGHTQDNGVVLAERVRLLDSSEKLPDEVEIETEDHHGDDNSGEESKDGENKDAGSESESKDESSNSGSESDNSGSGSDDTENDNTNDNSGSSNDENSDSSDSYNSGSINDDGSGKDENSDQNDSGGDDHSGSSKDESGGGEDSGGDNSGSGDGGGEED